MRRILPIFTMGALLSLAGAVAFQAPQGTKQVKPAPKRPTAGGDDEPIIIGDTHAIPITLRDAARLDGPFVKPVQFINGEHLRPDILHPEAPIVNNSANHTVQAVFVCSRPDIHTPYAVMASADFGGKNGHFDAGDLSILGAGPRARVSWQGSQIKVHLSGNPNAFQGSHTVGLDFSMNRVQWAGNKDYERQAADYDFRVVVHYCASSCTVSDFPTPAGACLEGVPTSIGYLTAAKQ